MDYTGLCLVKEHGSDLNLPELQEYISGKNKYINLR